MTDGETSTEGESEGGTLIPLASVDQAMVEELLDRAFGPDRHARTAYRIRAGASPLDALSYAALDDDDLLVGSIQCWPVALIDGERGDRENVDGEPRALPLIMVGPVAVLPERQGEGFGQALMAAMTEAETRMRHSGGPSLAQVLIGDAAYYGKWGFSAAYTGGWRCPGPYEPERLLARGDALPAMPAKGMLAPWLTD